MKNEKNQRSFGIIINKTYIIKEYKKMVEQKKNRFETFKKSFFFTTYIRFKKNQEKNIDFMKDSESFYLL